MPVRLTDASSGQTEEVTREDLLGRVFAKQHDLEKGVSLALDGIDASFRQSAAIREETEERDRHAMWALVGGFVVTGLGLAYAGKRAAAAEDMSFRAAKSARGVRDALNDLDSKLDKTNARMDALNDKVSYGFKTVLGVGEPKH